MATFTVAFYEIDRAYGGPEEGGWWFDTGRLERICRVFKNEAAAVKYADRANRLLDRIQRDIRDVGSAAYDGGRFSAQVWDEPPPPHYPESRPAYE